MPFGLRFCVPGLLVGLAACASPEPAVSNDPAPIDAAPPKVASLSPTNQPEPDIQAPLPESLLGILPADLSREIGNASLVRRDRGTEIWQYRADTCVLFFFLYSKAESAQPSELRVHHIDVRGDQDTANCLKNIVRKRTHRAQG